MTDVAKTPDRRRYPRANVSLPVTYRPSAASSKAPVRKEHLISIGRGGCFIQTKLTYPKDTKLQVEIGFENRAVSAIAEVRYAVPFNAQVKGAQFPGMGIAFINIEPEQAEFIGKYVCEVNASK